MKPTSGQSVASLCLAALSVGLWSFPGVPAQAVVPLAAVCVVLGFSGLREIRRSEGRLAGRGLAIGAGVVVSAAALFLGLSPETRKIRETTRRLTETSNLKRLALALHQYDRAHGSLPPHALHDEDGRPLLSWRVLILPFIEQNDLYQKFRLDEPWGSPHNVALLPEMPRLFGRYDRDPTRGPFTTFYQVFVGKGAAFEGTKGTRLAKDFPDGVSDTFLIVEGGTAVPWTKPDDLPFVPGGPLPELGGLGLGTIRAALADGSVYSFKRGAGEETIRAAITRNGGDALGPDW